MQQTYIAALEIGSSHIRLAVGSVDTDGTLTLLAKEDEPVNDSTSYGWIKNIDDIASRVNSLIRKIENYPSVSPRKIRGVYMGLGGRSLTANPVKINRQWDDEVELTQRMLDQLKEEARTSTLSSERRVLDVSPRSFVIDNQTTARPVGVLGRNIEAEFNVISVRNHGSINLNRIDTLAQRLNLSIRGKYVRQNALASLVLTPDEKDLGCMLVDFGAETTTVSIYRGGSMRYLVTLPLGSRNITRDLMALNLTEERAEMLKKAIGDAGNLTPTVERTDLDCNPVEVNNYVYHRAAEIAINIIEQVKFAGLTFNELPKGIILVGGGSNLRGLNDSLARLSQSPVRLGAIPASVRISDSRMQTLEMLDVISILKMAAETGAVECTEIPEHLAQAATLSDDGTHTSYNRTDAPDDDEVDDDDDDDIDEEDGPGPRPIKGRKAKAKKVKKTKDPSRPGLFTKVINGLSNFFDEREPEDQDN